MRASFGFSASSGMIQRLPARCAPGMRFSLQRTPTYIAGEVEKRGIGKSKINYRLRDAIFSRQRYWGEPFPVYYKDDLPYMLDESKLPLELPEVDKYLPSAIKNKLPFSFYSKIKRNLM